MAASTSLRPQGPAEVGQAMAILPGTTAGRPGNPSRDKRRSLGLSRRGKPLLPDRYDSIEKLRPDQSYGSVRFSGVGLIVLLVPTSHIMRTPQHDPMMSLNLPTGQSMSLTSSPSGTSRLAVPTREVTCPSL